MFQNELVKTCPQPFGELMLQAIIMKVLQQLLLLLFVQNLFGQSVEHSSAVNIYSKYKDSSFECEFKSTDKTILFYCEKAGKIHYTNLLSSHFGDDSTYRIVMTWLEINDSSVFEHEYVFEGNYEIDNDGNILLLGKHPFNVNSIKIKEKNQKNHFYTLRFVFKLNNDYNWANKQKLKAYCDGSCGIHTKE